MKGSSGAATSSLRARVFAGALVAVFLARGTRAVVEAARVFFLEAALSDLPDLAAVSPSEEVSAIGKGFVKKGECGAGGARGSAAERR